MTYWTLLQVWAKRVFWVFLSRLAEISVSGWHPFLCCACAVGARRQTTYVCHSRKVPQQSNLDQLPMWVTSFNISKEAGSWKGDKISSLCVFFLIMGRNFLLHCMLDIFYWITGILYFTFLVAGFYCIPLNNVGFCAGVKLHY